MIEYQILTLISNQSRWQYSLTEFLNCALLKEIFESDVKDLKFASFEMSSGGTLSVKSVASTTQRRERVHWKYS